MSDHSPIHVLSKRSALQGRNLFIWASGTNTIKAGMRIDNHLQLSFATLYRWMTIAAWNPNQKPFTLRPVEIIETNDRPFNYYIKPSGPVISLDSPVLVTPGDYAVFDASGSGGSHTFPFHQFEVKSFVDTERYILGAALPNSMPSITPPGMEKILRSKRNYCLPTGTRTDLAVTWIYPPSLVIELLSDSECVDYHNRPDRRENFLRPFFLEQNWVMISRDLLEPFQGNLLGVDVDDHYRVILFNLPASYPGCSLPAHLTLPTDPSLRPSDAFLREHFNRCIRVHTRGGDISEDYDPETVLATMDDLGVFDDDINFDDPDWQTPLGNAIWASLLKKGLQRQCHSGV